MALSFCGIYALLLDTNLPEATYQEMLQIVQTKALFISNGFSDMKFQQPKLTIDLDGNVGVAENFVLPPLTKDTIASLSFTSGTTGNAKVVPLTHCNVWRTSKVTAERWGEKFADKVVYALLPIYHVYGMVCAATAVFPAGSRIVFQTSLKAPEILKDLQQYKVNVFPAVPRIWENFLDRILKRFEEESKFKSRILKLCMEHGHQLKKVGLGGAVHHLFKPIRQLFGGEFLFGVSGGAALKKEYQQAYLNMGIQLAPGYGLTETVGPIVMSKPNSKKLGSVGKATASNYVQIRNENSEGIGEVWLKGDSVFNGYYKNPAATQEVFDAQHWFNSGDLGLIDRDGDLHLCGRKKNVIVLDSGKNVYPEDIVAYYKKSPLIAEISVFGRIMQDTEVVYAVIVPEHKDKDAYKHIDAEIRKLSHGLPTYKRIGKFAIAYDALPKTSTQKIKDHEVQANLERGEYQTAIDDPNFVVKELIGTTQEEEAVLTILRERLLVNVLFANQKLEDFEIDSLDYIDLISELEKRLDISIETEVLLNAKNMQEIVHYLSGMLIAKTPTGVAEYLVHSIVRTPLTWIYNPLLEIAFLLMRAVSRVLWNVQVVNSEKFISENAVIVANHQSYLDSLWLFAFMPRRQRCNTYIAIKKGFDFLKYLLPGFNFIFVDREGNNFIPILKAEADILRQGKSLVIFPEGNRTSTGKIGPFRTGAAFLAKNLKCRVLPVTIQGTFQILPRTSRFPRLLSRIKGRLTIHNYIDPEQFETIEALNQKMVEVISSDILQQP
jgi:long-chain acyl-CoA synthetase